MITTFLIIGWCLACMLGFTTYNLLKKVENNEDIILHQQNYINAISVLIEQSQEKLTEIDNKGSFEADDEIGFFFKTVKDIQEILNEFNITK